MNDDILKMLTEIRNLVLLGSKSIFNMDDLSLYTGISKCHIYHLISRNAIPYYKPNDSKFNYFKREEIDNWLLRNRYKTQEEMEQEAAAILALRSRSRK